MATKLSDLRQLLNDFIDGDDVAPQLVDLCEELGMEPQSSQELIDGLDDLIELARNEM